MEDIKNSSSLRGVGMGSECSTCGSICSATARVAGIKKLSRAQDYLGIFFCL